MICIVDNRRSDERQCVEGDELITQGRNLTHHTASMLKQVRFISLPLSVRRFSSSYMETLGGIEWVRGLIVVLQYTQKV